MKILHSGDIHLARDEDGRWDSLSEILDIAHEQECAFLAISGDLFDNETDAEALRAALRSSFEDAEFETLIIPGNHDAEAFRAGLYFGEGVRVLKDHDWSQNVVDREEVRIIGIPFEAMTADQFHRRLRSVADLVEADRTNILLYHGELLDASFDQGAFGPERGRYMPSRLAYFAELGVDYVLAGHFHSNFQMRGFGEDGFFVYPGSPVSVTRREVGQRSVALIDPGKAPQEVPLETHHYQRVEVTLDAFADGDPIEVVRSHLQDMHPMATVLLSVDGTIRGMREQELWQAMREATADMPVEISPPGFRDVSHILQHPVYGLFQSRLEALQAQVENPLRGEEAEKLRRMLIRAMSEVGV